MNEGIILKPLGIFRGPVDKGIQYYTLSGEDAVGTLFAMHYGTKFCYIDSIEKAFSRLVPLKLEAPEQEPPLEADIIDIEPDKGEPTNGAAA